LEPAIPAGSLLAKWQLASSQAEKQKLAEQLQELLTSGASIPNESPDAKLYQQLASLNGPLFGGVRKTEPSPTIVDRHDGSDANWGVDPAIFGRHPNGSSIEAASLCVQAPSIIEIRLPVDLVGGSEFIATGTLHTPTGIEGSVQFQLLTNKPSLPKGLLAGSVTETQANGPWTSNNQRISHNLPIVTASGSEARKRVESSFDDFRRYFPAALCYAKIVPVDEVITLTLFHREDDQLARLMLDDAQKAKLDRLWDHLRYVSQDALTMVDAFEQLWQYATQDADPKVFEPLRKPIQDRAAGFRKRLIDTQPAHLQAVIDFARRAYRRPLAEAEQKELRDLYAKLRAQEVPHDDAVRLLLARLFVTPAFLYRSETTAPGKMQVPVNDWELASRLSYFLWSSMPDAELFRAAASGKLHDSTVLAAQTRRMLRDPRVRRLSIEFACQWLHIHDFDTLDEKSDRHFPTFTGLRGDMYEESILYFTDLFREDEPVLNILDSDYTFLNESLAKHYEIPGITGNEWRRVEGIKKFSRGGILAQATTLSKQSGASRTSPILRGNWVAEALLGDKLPKPPKDVPRLPEDEATENLTVRQLTEKHSTDPRCYACHMRIDGFGFALESFDAIGRFRQNDLGGRPIDAKSKLMDGTQVDGIAGLREYLSTKKRDVFLRQFNRKLLGYSLGREVQLSDKPLLTEMLAQMQASDYHIGTAVESIVKSRQFREIRGREMSNDD
ncbi:MAG: cytochrome, partial [Verrucomicrobiales bacterium]|nr:cytochrome [Verrucomicrobiales bacterium]